LGQTQQKKLALRERIANLQTQLGHLQHNSKTLETDLRNGQESFAGSERAILDAEAKLAGFFQARQEHQVQSRNLRGKYEELQSEKARLTELAHEQSVQKEQLQEQLHETQMELNENRLRSENLTQRAQEELELNLLERFTDYEHQEIDWEAVRQEIEELKRKIERLGNINLDAIAEQEELEQRADNLNRQLADLEEAQRQLEQLIAKINRESEELFRVIFEAIRIHFEELFRKLFGGGRAEIILEDPENILECGIEIIARPPGKQLQSISLLSGGEKTLTAVALLLAIFKSKPSPFCLLDEVDAALDEANIERFTLVIQEFLKDSQFVIVTHSRRTMTIADVIYGITMQEQGVSKKVSVRFAGEEQKVETDSAVA
jgi:chromosome segregation protein